jgi:hypothetical protein
MRKRQKELTQNRVFQHVTVLVSIYFSRMLLRLLKDVSTPRCFYPSKPSKIKQRIPHPPQDAAYVTSVPPSTGFKIYVRVIVTLPPPIPIERYKIFSSSSWQEGEGKGIAIFVSG